MSPKFEGWFESTTFKIKYLNNNNNKVLDKLIWFDFNLHSQKCFFSQSSGPKLIFKYFLSEPFLYLLLNMMILRNKCFSQGNNAFEHAKGSKHIWDRADVMDIESNFYVYWRAKYCFCILLFYLVIKFFLLITFFTVDFFLRTIF